MQFSSTIAPASAIMLAFIASANAHANMAPPVAVPGASYYGAARIPHGCNGTGTVNVTLTIPDNVTSVKPRLTYNWDVSTTLRPLVPPITAESGAIINTTIATIVWSNGTKVLPDSQWEDFQFSAKLPAGADGDIIYFSVMQYCENGESYNWAQIPGKDPVAPNGHTVSTAPKISMFTNGTAIKAAGSTAEASSKANGASSSTAASLIVAVGATIFGSAVYFL